MQTMLVSITEASRRLEELLVATDAGHHVVITRRGKPIVRLVRVIPSDKRAFGTPKGMAAL